jgi:RNA polymerase sigma factor (sigma-70 family)
VTSKTIQRWRRRGLPARRFVFPDGKRRVGFLLSSVERFFTAHRDQVPTARNLSNVDETENDLILRRAKILAKQCGCWEDEIARRIARKLNRSPATVLHTIRKHDAEHPQEKGILHWAPIPVPQDERSRILRAYRHGVSIRSLSRKYHQSRSSIYRVIMAERIARLNRKKVRFIDDPLYHQDDAQLAIRQIVEQDEISGTTGEELRTPRDLPPYLQELYRTPLLTPGRERALFLKFNFHKFQFIQLRKQLEPQFARSRDLDLLEQHRHDAIETKNQIVRANLRLVVSIARKHLRPGLNLMELISDGNVTLMRAVEGFDIHKGNRFSTYASLALMKGFARSVPMMRAMARCSAAADRLGEMPDARNERLIDEFLHREQVMHLLSRLDDRERAILQAHYGLEKGEEPASYEQLGQRMGMSKQRIKQIERGAIEKLRAGV